MNPGPDWQPSAALAGLPMAAPDAHRGALRLFATGVCLITAAHGGERAGLTATAVCSVTLSPPRLVVFVNKKVAAVPLILDSGALCVNLLAADQIEVAKAFAGMLDGVHGPARFGYGRWDRLVSGAPTLARALARFDCRVIKVFDESTHHAFLCEVLASVERDDRDAEPLLYLDGEFRRIPRAHDAPAPI
jgi:flavin reductase (NADH)/flavin reductase